MQQHIQTLVKHIFRKDNLKDVSVNELEQFTANYPYAAIGQYLLARKLKENGNEEEFVKQADKTSLYFNNPLWAHWQLQAQATVQHDHSTTVDETVANATAAVAATEPEPAFSVVSLAEEAVELQESQADEPEISSHQAETTPEVIAPQSIEEDYLAGQAHGDEPADIPFNDIPVLDTNDSQDIEIPVHSSNEGELIESSDIPETEQTALDPQAAVPEETTLILENPEPALSISDEIGGTPMQAVTAGQDEDIFEPYHTIDYFASQGIKLSKEDTNTINGKLDKQLKSFTDWLRSMKKITPAAKGDLDDSTNQSIVKIAEYSVSGNEIITEAMAEVWAKQGNLPRAIAIYEKLSLLNPTKNTYFASRIQQAIAQKPD